MENSMANKDAYKLRIDLVNYHNPNNLLSDGEHCDVLYIFKNSCDPRFDILIYE